MWRISLSRLIFINAAIFWFLTVTSSHAYNRQPDSFPPYGGHEEITEFSMDYLNYDVELKKALGVNRGDIVKANAAEDNGANSRNHFYGGLGGHFDNAIMRSKSLYEEALDKYRNGDKSGGWDKIGHALHLLQDMASPSHAMDASHVWHFRNKKGYEWWVQLNWNTYIKPQLTDIFNTVPGMKDVPQMGEMWVETAFMGLMAKGFAYDLDSWTYPQIPLQPSDTQPALIVGPADAYYNAMMLIPQAIKAGGHLFKGFWRDVGGGGPTPPSATGTPGGDHPDDNFDVSSRLIKLEEMDTTKELWKDLYARVGIKKGYIELFAEKKLTDLYNNVLEATTDDDFSAAYVAWLTGLNNSKNAPRHTFEEAYFASPDVKWTPLSRQ